mgnify:CR=1 FL=1
MDDSQRSVLLLQSCVELIVLWGNQGEKERACIARILAMPLVRSRVFRHCTADPVLCNSAQPRGEKRARIIDEFTSVVDRKASSH